MYIIAACYTKQYNLTTDPLYGHHIVVGFCISYNHAFYEGRFERPSVGTTPARVHKIPVNPSAIEAALLWRTLYPWLQN